MIQIYLDDNVLAYDSRMEDLQLLDLTVTTGVNKGGSATITMPYGHFAYNNFVSFKTIVSVYQDNVLKFRGRPLYPTDDFLGHRTITCEGERCFLRDAVSRPYDYQESPEEIFFDVIEVYNSQVEAAKRFVVGDTTVTDPNDYIRLYSETAEQVSDTVDKLVERCGGFVVFTTNERGQRVINWLAELNHQSTQTIEFGENLLDFSRSANTDLATRIIPYGAKDEATGERVTITSVNDGLDYVEDSAAVALRGVIAKPVYWDDVTVAANLKVKAQQYLATSKLVITALSVSAVNLAAAGKDIDHFRVGDNIHVISKPHGVDDWMQLQELTEDLLNPANSTVTLGKSYATLTAFSATGNRDAKTELQRTASAVRSDCSRDLAAVEEGFQDHIGFDRGVDVYDDIYMHGDVIEFDTGFSIGADGQLRQPEMVAPTLKNNWVNYGGAWAPASYWKDSCGMVRLNGLIKNGTTSAGTILFTLPVGYRPSKKEKCMCCSGAALCILEVDASGNVSISFGATSGWLSLSGIAFRVQ